MPHLSPGTSRGVVVALVAPGVLLLAGCGSSARGPQADATLTPTVAATPSASASASASSTGGTTKPSPSASASRSPAIVLGGSATYAETYFATPSGNIGCYLLRHEGIHQVECSLKSQSFAVPPRPADCDLAWVPQFTLGRAASYGACRGDVAGTPTDAVLPYGERAVDGPITCRSETTGLTCTNSRTGRGFVVSRAAYRLF